VYAGAIKPKMLLLHALSGEKIKRSQETKYIIVPPMYRISPCFCVEVEMLKGINIVRMKSKILEMFSAYFSQAGISSQNVSGWYS
jgi:hypothetical protein